MMSRNLLVVLTLVTAAFAAGCSPASGDDLPADVPLDRGDADADGIGPPPPDYDGDTISDEDEDRPVNLDTDGDGTPDWQDDDSDNDTIPDSLEAGDADPRTAPGDADGDGMPNFRDPDSDGNGIPDAVESRDDLDSDTILDFADLDDDGDGIGDVVEIDGNPTDPPDFEGDGIPDYRDVDSDDDFIGDRDEATADTDGDTTPDRFDSDTDGDSWTDAEEAGDADINTPVVDTDLDTVPDFRDPDSDADGLADDLERTAGTSRTNPDSDDDGVNDMIEVAAGTNPLDPGDSPRTRGDFVFLEPYNDPTHPPTPPLDPDPLEDTLLFSTNIQYADVYFLMDTTGSMGGAVSNLKSSLSSTVIPAIAGAIPSAWYGVGGFEDYQNDACGYGYSSSGDQVFYQFQTMTRDPATAQAAVNRYATHFGGDGPESDVPALVALATGRGDGRYVMDAPACPADSGSIGYPCFRPGAVPIVILITDITFHNGPGGSNLYDNGCLGITAPTYPDAIAALSTIGAKVIGINVGGGASDLATIARDTGAVDTGGSPLVYSTDWGGSGLGTEVVNGVQTLATNVPLRIDAVPVDDPSDAVDAPAEFIDYIEANASGESITDPVSGEVRICTVTDPLPVDDPADGHPDYFPRVLPGVPVCFDIHVKQNWTVPATREPQMFRATIQVMGDRITILDERDVFFLVPPEVTIIIE
ncbi:MAG: VWA domain-containing protein [Myxococcales bacterium]|nr:VWA domain-containing protein [Myxococcales bacterium]